jgi:hypothetical protein
MTIYCKDREKFQHYLIYKGDQKINGYEATILIDICDAFLQARKEIKELLYYQVVVCNEEIKIPMGQN